MSMPTRSGRRSGSRLRCRATALRCSRSRASNRRARSIAGAACAAASCSSAASALVNSRGVTVPDVQHAEDGALDEQRHAEQRAHALHAQDRVEDRRRGRRRRCRSACGPAAMRPAKPPPTGMRTPRSTSSSRPLAARATSSWASSSRSRMAAVSTPRMSFARASSSSSSGSSGQLGERRDPPAGRRARAARRLVERRLVADAEEDLAVSGRRERVIGGRGWPGAHSTAAGRVREP